MHGDVEDVDGAPRSEGSLGSRAGGARIPLGVRLVVSGLDESAFIGEDDGLDAVAAIELREDPVDV